MLIFSGKAPDQVIVVSGTLEENNGTTHNVSKIVIHPGIGASSYGNDIALWKVKFVTSI